MDDSNRPNPLLFSQLYHAEQARTFFVDDRWVGKNRDSETDLQGMKRVGAVVAEALAAMKAAVKPGVTPADLNELCGEVFARYGAVSAPRLEYGAPVNAFISVMAKVASASLLLPVSEALGQLKWGWFRKDTCHYL